MIQPSVSSPTRPAGATGADVYMPPRAAATIDAMFREACRRDPVFDEHAWGVARLARAAAAHIGLTGPRLELLTFAALVHDLGKALIPSAVMAKEGPLDEDEWRMIHEHPAAGAEILASCSAPPRAIDAVRSHHERWDGAGYPHGLADREIPLAGRIIAAADAYCAMIEPRSYRPRRTPAAARAEMLAQAGAQFDVECARAVVAVTAA